MSNQTVSNSPLDTQPNAEQLASSANLRTLTEASEKNGVEILRCKVAAGNMIVLAMAGDSVMSEIYAGALPLARMAENKVKSDYELAG